MYKLAPETEQEQILMAMSAMFIEEHNILEQIYPLIEADIDLQDEEAKTFVKEHIIDAFLKLDMNLDVNARADYLEFLSEMWNINDRNTALGNIDYLKNQGHRQKFTTLKNNVGSLYKFKEIFNFDFSENEEVKLSDKEYEQLMDWVAKADKFVPNVGLLAWDIARCIFLIRISFVVGFLNDQEAWTRINSLWPLVQNKFKDWDEFAQSFLIGRTFWAGSEDPELKEICIRLASHKASPWMHFKINL